MNEIQQSISLLNQGQVAPAIHILNQLLKGKVATSDVHQLLGVAYFMQQELKKAEKHLLKALKITPSDTDASYNLAKLYFQTKQFNKAKTAIDATLKHRNDWPEGLFVAGLINVSMRQHLAGYRCFQAVVNQLPNNFEAICNAASALYELERFDEAIDLYTKTLKLKENHLPAICGLADALTKAGKELEAIASLEDFVEVYPIVEIYNRLAVACKHAGLKEKVAVACKASLELDPMQGRPYRLLAEVNSFTSIDDLRIFSNALVIDGFDIKEKKYIHFALGEAYESLNLFSDAMDEYDLANQLHRKTYQYSIQDDEKKLALYKEAYPNGSKSWAGLEMSDLDGVVFIVGMPRTGTSLVEQVLASHSQVSGAGELNYMELLWHSVGAKSAAEFHLNLAGKGDEYQQKLGREYLTRVSSFRKGAKLVTDKLPLNIWQLGQIKSILPNAKIVHCRRHPAATCLSIYKSIFSGTHPYAYDQKELAQYYNIYSCLMEHWRQVYPDGFYEVSYEALVTNQEEETRKLLEYCELPWEDACLDFHKNKRAVKTASAYQVRQSMHTKSVDLWKRYGDGLKPLIDNLYIPEEYQD